MMFAKASLAIAAAAMTLTSLSAAPASAQQVQTPSQTSPQSSTMVRDANGTYYDPCQRSTVNRTTGGSLLGAAIGAAIGAGIAGKNNKTEGAVLGGVLGAVTGANVGNSSAACEQSRTFTRQSENRYYGNRGNVEVYSTEIYRGYTPYPRHRDWDRDRHFHDHDNDDRDFDHDVSERSVRDRCTLAESPIYMPDGSIQKRFVRVCHDGRGRYQVVQ